MLWLLLACQPPAETTTPTWTTTTTPPDPVPTTPTVPPPPDPCEADTAPTVLDVTTEQPWHANELSVTVTLSSEATAAVACTLDDDPDEVHLAESSVPGTAHTLRIPGLLAASGYSCAAAAVCPAGAEPAAFAVTTAEPAPGFYEMVPTSSGDHGDEYVLLNQTDDCNDQYQRVVVADREGRIRWWYRTPPFVGKSIDFRYHGADRFAWGGGWGPNAGARPRKIHLYNGEFYDSASAMPDFESSGYHHDGKQLPDGRLLTLEEVDVDDFRGFRVRRIDPVTDTVDFDYHGQRAYDEGHLPHGSGDAWHANWVDIVDDTLYVSLCFVSRVLAIDVPSGDVRWVFGPGGDLEVVDTVGEPLGSDGFTDCQHGLQITGDGRMLVYDNGGYRGARSYSRASAYAIDEATLTATMLWTWTEPDWFESTLGSIDELPSGNVLIGAGHAECFSSNRGDRTTILEVDPVSGEKVWQLRFADVQGSAYRADFADPCALFGNARYCTTVRERLQTLGPVLGR